MARLLSRLVCRGIKVETTEPSHPISPLEPDRVERPRKRSPSAAGPVVTTDAAGFTSLAIPELRPAILEGRRQHGDYVLRLMLWGVPRWADDVRGGGGAVILQSAQLWRTKNAARIQALEGPLESSGTNLRSYHRRIDELAEIFAEELSSSELA